jgi:trans-2,3-dihydro-3-hydroxyanthranilate isomerase
VHPLHGLPFRHVDVFSDQPLSGNGLSVFWDASALTPDLMQRITQEMRQFESIFLTPTDDSHTYRARIFTMEEELDFAGHPILGAAAVLHERCSDDDSATWTLQLNAKQVEVQTRRTGSGYHAAMDQGAPVINPPLDERTASVYLGALNLTEADQAAGYPLQLISTGLPYLIVPVASGLAHAQIKHSDFEGLLAAVGAKFVYVRDINALEGRTWDNDGRVEDIATGSAAGPAGVYLCLYGAAPTNEDITLHQGQFTGRPSTLTVQVIGSSSAPQRVIVSGGVTMIASGTFD